MFYRSPGLRRTVAAFLLLQTTTELLWPVTTYALTAGPTAPEATSFEPVDTTDMVNLNSGDMSYGVPLLEVPGPEGGYPLALSYHAGIQPEEEASWVGLGWGLNPGAISRNVNGYADDLQDAQQSVRDYWEGGKTETTRVGVSFGVAGGAASVSVGLAFSQDTYLGFGVGSQLGLTVGKDLGGGGSAGVSAVIGVTGYGQTYGGVGIGVSGQLGQATGNVGLSTNFQSVSASVGVGITNGDPQNHIKSTFSSSLLGASISSSGSKPTFSVGGGTSSFRNDKSGKIQTDVQSQSMDLPVFYGVSISLGYDYVRYWSDETEMANVSGALYYPKQASSAANLDNHDYDTYRLLDPKNANILENPDPDYLQGGSFPSYDNYSVVAQGLSGSIRPYSFQEGLYSKNRKNKDGAYIIQDNPANWNNKAVSFRFENDFSNQYRQQNAAVTPIQGGAMSYSFDSNPIYGNNDGTAGYDPVQDRLAGSKHIEWFTNQDIASGVSFTSVVKQKGFIDTEARGFVRDNNTQVGGFMVTNESGVTYHFALPAYSYKETVYTENSDRETRGLVTNTINRPAKYAYTWFLTAITGPDYVDRNQNGLVDATDWGYWVAFDYGKWTDDFQWRNPSEGLREDIDGGFKSYSTGFKEVYYLNKVRTRTHTALFEKEVRADGKSYAGSAGYEPKRDGGPNIPPGTTRDQWDGSTWSSTTMPKASLRLTNIYLLNNADVPGSLENRSITYDFKNYASQRTLSNGAKQDVTYIRDHHYGKNIIDVYDTKVLKDQLLNSAIRIIQFNYDYSLNPATVNSYDPTARNYTSFDNTVLTTRIGKLTLQSLSFLGLKGAGVLPDTKFYYELSPQETRSENIQIASGQNGDGTDGEGYITGVQADKFQSGDILTFLAQGKQIYCTVLKVQARSPAPYYKVLFLNSGYPQPGSYQVSTTKNPPYVKDFHDTWNHFKSDMNLEVLKVNENIARKTTSTSARGVDVWSLRRITSALGSTVAVDYESDDYKDVALRRPEMLARFGNKSYYEGFYTQQDPNFQAWMSTQPGVGVISLIDIKAKISSFLTPGQEVLVSGIVEDWSCDCNGSSNSSCIYRAVSNKRLTIKSIQEIDPNTGNRANLVYLDDPTREIFKSVPCNVTNNSVKGITHLVMGHLQSIPSNENIYGGGVRVKSITLAGSGLTHKTRYMYANANVSTGTTSIEPGSIRSFDKTLYDYYKGKNSAVASSYRSSYYDLMPHLLAIGREVPGPGVMYKNVGVTEEVVQADGRTETVPGRSTYEFEVFRPDMISVGEIDAPLTTGNPEVRTSNMAIKDRTTQIGSLKRITQYGANGIKLSETINHYSSDDISSLDDYKQKLAAYNYQGVVEERFGDCRRVLRTDGNYDTKLVMSKREVYPSIKTGATTTDFRTGLTNWNQTLAFDFYSGSPTQSVSADGYGNRFMTVTTPAYRKYPAMGLKLGAASNRNMLTQEASVYTYKVDQTNRPVSVVAASAQTWSNQVPVVGLTDNSPEQVATQPAIWRLWQTYNWMPASSTADGLTPMTGSNSFVGFDYNSPTPAVSWKLTSQVTLYNAYSNALEARDMQNIYMATKMGFNQSKVLVSGGPAVYQELAYSGAEETKAAGDYFSGAVAVTWTPGSGSDPGGPWGSGNVEVSSTTAHTGSRSLRVGTYKNGFSYIPNVNGSDPKKFCLDPTKPYRMSVWTNDAAGYLYYVLDGKETGITGTVQKRTTDGWYLLDLILPPIGTGHTNFRVSCYNSNPNQSIYFDDFRFQPLNAQAISYVYDQKTGQVTDILDNNNLFTHYDYDAAGQLRKVSRETFQFGAKALTAHNYHYSGAPTDLTNARLTVITQGKTATIKVEMPPSATPPAAIAYNVGIGTAYTSTALSTFSYSYPTTGTYWIKVRIGDTKGRTRELAYKLVL